MRLKKAYLLFSLFWLGQLGGLIISPAAYAVKFANQFTEFELPPQWQCSLEGAEWVCQSTNDQKKRDAIIVLAAKLKGDQDSLDQYLAYLKSVKNFSSVQGKPIKSEPKWARTESINGQAWVDSMHLESEIPGFYTRYLATVKQDIGILITYSVNKDKYQLYLQDFDNLVKTLKVFRKSGAINTAPANTSLFSTTQIPAGMSASTVFSGVNPEGGAETTVQKPKADSSSWWPILLIAGALGYLAWRRKQSRG